MTEHTQTPWALHDRWLMSPVGPVPIASGYQDWVTAPGGSKFEEWKANAAFIVKAVNSHDALVKALADILEANKDFRASLPKCWEGDPLQDACERATSVLDAVGTSGDRSC